MSCADDEDRFRTLLKEMIGSGEVEAFPKFTSESAKVDCPCCRVHKSLRSHIPFDPDALQVIKERKRRAKKEAAEAEAALREIQAKNPAGSRAGKSKKAKPGSLDITAMIQSNQSKRGAAFGSIFDKFGAADEPPDLPDAAFAAVGARMGAGAAQPSKGSKGKQKKKKK